jgi:hypothetical protein
MDSEQYQVSENIQVLRKKGHLLLIPDKGAKMLKVSGPPADVVSAIFRGEAMHDTEKLIGEKYSELHEPKEAVQEIIRTLSVRGVLITCRESKTEPSFGEKIAFLINSVVLKRTKHVGFGRFSKGVFIFGICLFVSLYCYCVYSLFEFLNYTKLAGLNFTGMVSTAFSAFLVIVVWFLGHEFSHALVSGRMGVRISSVSIGRFGGLIPLPFMDIRRAWVIDRWSHGMIALSGPLFDVSFMTALLFFSVSARWDVDTAFLVSVFGVIMVLSNSNLFGRSDMALVCEAVTEDPELRLKALGVVNTTTDDIRNIKLYRFFLGINFLSFMIVISLIAYQLWTIF